MSQPGAEVNRPRSLVPKLGMPDERKSLGEVQERRPRWEAMPSSNAITDTFLADSLRVP